MLHMSLENLSDENVARYYDQIRRLADEDRAHKRHFTASPSIRERAERLRDEMTRRRLHHSPINWPS
jgi:23S rRNA A2030 N6-methylase RlmJ